MPKRRPAASTSPSKLPLLLLVLCQLTLAETSLWKVSNHQHSLYLGGTVHVLRDNDYPLPQAYQRAFDDADLIILETDLQATQNTDFQRILTATVRYPQGETLSDHLSPAAERALQQYCQQSGIAMQALMPYKPAWTMLTLLSIELKRLGIAATGVDHYYMQRALDENKPMAGLETAQQQLSFIANLGTGSESTLILHTLDELEQIGQLLDEMVHMWRSGDIEALERTFVRPMATDYPDIYRTLLVERNNTWLPQLERHLRENRTALVLVGAAHLVGEDGLLAQLQQKGYQISQL
jgi:uncharacterized protein YbaP (TraB family)